jgi:mannose/fructose/N-acetylgalactosamine-specific phosphotransferase system component IIC
MEAHIVVTQAESYPARLNIDYPEKLDRFSTFFRLIWIIPIAIIATLLSATSSSTITTVIVTDAGEIVTKATESGGGIVAGLFAATLLMIVFRQRYPRWWFDFGREFARFSTRVGAYLVLLTDQYPSTEDEQAVHLEIDYPDAEKDLNRFLPLVKWLLAIPHYIVLIVLAIGAIFAIFISWFAILFTGRYPRVLFDYVVGVARWGLRVQAYAMLLVTDDYPPFSLE